MTGVRKEQRDDLNATTAPEWDHRRHSRGLGTVAALIDYVLIAEGLTALAFTYHHLFGDGERRANALTQLLSGHGLSGDRYSLIAPLFASPMWWIGKAAGDIRTWLQYYNLVLFALALTALFLLLRTRVDAVLLRRFILLLIAGTMIAPHVSDFYGETFTAMTVGVGILAAIAVTTHPAVRALGWVAMTLGGANTAAALPALGLVAGEQSLITRRLRYLTAVVAAAALVLLENWLRRGDPLDQGYGEELFSYPFALGILAILFSFGKGLVFFTPGLVLPIRQKIRGLYDPNAIDLWRGYRSWLVFLTGLILVYASWWAWNGDLYWGPRFFLIAIFPASLALAVWLTQPDRRPLANLALIGVLGLSLWVGASSTVFELVSSPRCSPPGTPQEDLCRFGVEDSKLWYPLLEWPQGLSFTAWFQLLYHALVFIWLAAPVVVLLFPAGTSGLRRLRAALRLRDVRF